ncbi:hypothetical protein N7467_004453 [Penicillium canescens]|nr:hypothetical protein N7467_004453 [Penicillium canescens]
MPESHQSTLRDSSEESQTYLTYAAATASLRKKLIRKEKDHRFQYHLMSVVFNLIAVAQIIVGAAITALGPSGGEHTLAITILRTFNTSIAGLLALLKGRGLPERLRRNSTEISKVLDFIQERGTLLRYGNSHVSDDEISVLLQEAFRSYASAEQITSYVCRWKEVSGFCRLHRDEWWLFKSYGGE